MFQVQTAVVKVDLRRRMRDRRSTVPAVICNGLVNVIVRIFGDFVRKYVKISSDYCGNLLLRVSGMLFVECHSDLVGSSLMNSSNVVASVVA